MVKKMLKLFVCALVIGLTAGLANADTETGLVAYWPFEEGDGTTTADVTGHGYDGTLVGLPEWDSGPDGFGGALLFDVGSSGDRVECGTACNPSAGTGKFTLAIWAYWMRTVTTQQYQHFMTKSDSWGVDTMMWQWELYGGSTYSNLIDKIGVSYAGLGTIALSSSTMPVNEWTHLAVTFNGTVAQLYINGVADPLGPQSFIIGSNATDAQFYIGVDSRYTRSFDGYLDEARVYNRDLLAEDVMELVSPDPDYNFAPQVEAGDYQSLLWPDNLAQLAPVVSDDGKPGTPLIYAWSQFSGPGTVVFSDPGIEAPTATFPTAGMYELQLSVSDGEKDSCDVVAVQVRANNDPIARWNFEEGDGTTVGDSSAYNNVGTSMGGEPNWVPGWVGNWAMKCSDGPYTSIAVDAVADPNLDTQKYEVTVSAWVKVDNWLSEWAGIVTKGSGATGNGGWLLMRNKSTDNLAFSTPGAGIVKGSVNIKDGNWHHIAGVHNGTTIFLYVDGVLDTSEDALGLVIPKASDIAELWINGNSNIEGNFFDGMVDDVHIYSYGLSDVQVAELAAMGALIPAVDAGADDTFYIRNEFYQLAATVTDDGNPEPATLAWTQTSGPGVAEFSDAAIESPTVTFSEVGTYDLRLTADDSLAQIYDEVRITVADPICQDVITGGLLIAGDLSGPAGEPDCRIDMYDFAAFASYWLTCNDPQDLECDFPY